MENGLILSEFGPFFTARANSSVIINKNCPLG